MENNGPHVETMEHSETYGKFVVEPLERGYGVTLANSLRRVLLSSLRGAAITSVRIDGVLHEFATIPGLREDTTELILNLKSLAIKVNESAPPVSGGAASAEIELLRAPKASNRQPPGF